MLMMSKMSGMLSGGSGTAGPSVAGLFASTLYTGTGGVRSVVTGVDTSLGGMVWTKNRTTPSAGVSDNLISDTINGAGQYVRTNTTSPQASSGNSLTSFGSTGISFGTNSNNFNESGVSYIVRSFKKASNFFDIISYTGNSTAGRTIPHSLGVAPGFMFFKRLDDTADWPVFHRSIGAANVMYLNLAFGSSGDGGFLNTVAPNSTNITLGSNPNINTSGGTYVGYLIAHHDAASGFVKCVSFTTNGSGAASYDTEWAEGAQFCMFSSSTTATDWEMYETARTPAFTGNDARLRANLSSNEDTVTRISQSSGVLSFSGLAASQTYAAVFIRAEA